ncbi:MAG: hypothetical protein GY870_19350 [archaeon]|nr:hypothetical protein [archaeon]
MDEQENIFNLIKLDIIKQLQSIKYQGIHIDDIGNEIGVAISKYVNQSNSYNKGLSKEDFICGLEHGIELGIKKQ